MCSCFTTLDLNLVRSNGGEEPSKAMRGDRRSGSKGEEGRKRNRVCVSCPDRRLSQRRGTCTETLRTEKGRSQELYSELLSRQITTSDLVHLVGKETVRMTTNGLGEKKLGN